MEVLITRKEAIMDTRKLNFVIIVLFLILIVCFLTYYTNSLDYNLNKSKINFDNILLIAKEEDKIIVFHKFLFEDDYGLGVSMFQKNQYGWSTKIDTAEKMDSEVTFNYLYINDKQTSIYGYINDTSIDKIRIQYNNASEFVEIIDTDWKKIWIHELKNDNFKIEFYDKNDKLLYTIN